MKGDVGKLTPLRERVDEPAGINRHDDFSDCRQHHGQSHDEDQPLMLRPMAERENKHITEDLRALDAGFDHDERAR
ncbi:hypothetical protein GCM10011487_35840 [Steroidobacter agaridevorans]|uniref:Uncharacterized protein n=1 Tax=Steroidobacter agaridevorans TaxID=2695856 RepID=A0A829YE53_9GAMM|nr:hypothetical protein GCM10011487_35840 [Steroidobacter agaridevorans]